MDLSDQNVKYKKVIDNIKEAVDLLESVATNNVIDDSEILKLFESIGGWKYGSELLKLMDGKLDAWDDVFTVIRRIAYNYNNQASTSNVGDVVAPEQGNNFQK